MTFENQIVNYGKASYPLIAINTFEEHRAVQDIKKAWLSRSNTGKIYSWDTVMGISCDNDPLFQSKEANAAEALEFILGTGGREDTTLFILKDFHLELQSKMHAKLYIRQLKIAAALLKAKGSMIIFISHNFDIPDELLKDVQTLDYNLPDEKAIQDSLNFIKQSVDNSLGDKAKEELSPVFISKTVEAAKGMTSSEIETSFALASVVNKGKFTEGFTQSVFEEKIQNLKKTSLLTHIDSDISFSDIGGLQGIKKWIQLRKSCFTKEAKDFGIATPRGTLLCGISGAGKTMIAKAISKEFEIPLFALDIGRLFDSLVGSSERRVREVIKTIDAVGRCTIMIDEVEKSLNKNAVSGSSDSGTSSRVFGSLLTYLSDRESNAFFVMTSNNFTVLPMELIRSGRLSSLFWIDLPTVKERKEIWNVIIKKYGRKVSNFDTGKFAKASDQFVGAEIDQVFQNALFRAFAEGQEIQDHHINLEIAKLKPHAKRFPDELKLQREKAKDNLQMAGEDGEIEDVEAAYRALELE